jgi:hypothetical protein
VSETVKEVHVKINAQENVCPCAVNHIAGHRNISVTEKSFQNAAESR